jgi:hypothetical protein
MLRPSASKANRSTLTPTRMRKSESATDGKKGKIAQMARKAKNRGPGPTLSNARLAGPVKPV